MSRLVIFPFKETSEGAILLRDTLKTEFITRRTRMDDETVVINWGCGYTSPPGMRVFNTQDAINRAIRKLTSFQRFQAKNVPCPEVTVDIQKAKRWLNQGHIVYGRADCAENGHGTKIYNPGDTIETYHDFYSKRFPTAREFRVNVAFGEAIDVCEKKQRNGTRPNHLLRVGDDWVYCRENLDGYPKTLVKGSAIKAVKSLGLDFGGVDVGVSDDDEVCVFEVNTAPWLGTIIARKYANAFEQAVLGDREWEDD